MRLIKIKCRNISPENVPYLHIVFNIALQNLFIIALKKTLKNI